MKLVQKPPQIPFIRKLCAHLPEDEIEAAEARLLSYFDLCGEIAETVMEQRAEEGFDKSDNHP